MAVLKSRLLSSAALIFSALLLSSCQLGYYMHTGYNQLGLWWDQISVQEALKDPRLSESQKEKIRLVQQAKDFAEKELKLKGNGNYDSFVRLDRDAVTYVVQVAYANRLQSYKWEFPFIGAVPYKGYFRKELARKEAEKFPSEKYDTWIRGVKAYSTLGWFRDPLTSPMLTYLDRDLVETIIHELTHTTLYIKNAAEFNERFATFVGGEGAKLFYRRKEGPDSSTAALIEKEQEDLKEFSTFISKELRDLREWYVNHDEEFIIVNKPRRIEEIQARFREKLKPRLKTDVFNEFAKRKLNNAVLLSFETYVSDLSLFQKLYEKSGKSLPALIKEVSKLEESKTPNVDLKALVESL